MYALNLAADGRILSATCDRFAAAGMPVADTLPKGDLADYRYLDGEYMYDPLPAGPAADEPTQLDRIEAQLAYTAMMTDTLLEV